LLVKYRKKDMRISKKLVEAFVLVIFVARGRGQVISREGMQRSLVPSFVFALIGLLGGIIYRYLADDPNEGTLANYMRSAVHRAGLALSG
jgi:hypothetical protein